MSTLITQYHDLTSRNLGAVSRSYLSKDGSKLYTAVRYPGQVAHSCRSRAAKAP